MNIRALSNRDKDFYMLMGPFLANRKVETEIGYPIYDDDNKVWFLAFEGDEVIGFCYLQETRNGKYQIGSCYVTEQSRGQGVFQGLLNEALSRARGIVELTTNKEHVANTLVPLGFSATSTRGSYTVYRKELQHG